MGTLTDKARELAELAHAGQTDKAGRPYIEHPAFVASMMETDGEKAVAWLHDVLEDTDVSAESLAKAFPAQIMEALNALTHRNNENYEEYIKRVRLNPLAAKVKLADLTHNMDLNRLPCLSKKDFDRVEKYKRAYNELWKSLPR